MGVTRRKRGPQFKVGDKVRLKHKEFTPNLIDPMITAIGNYSYKISWGDENNPFKFQDTLLFEDENLYFVVK